MRTFYDLGANHLIYLNISFFICPKEIILAWSTLREYCEMKWLYEKKLCEL